MRRLLALAVFLVPVIGFSQIGSIELDDKPVPQPAKMEQEVLAFNNASSAYNTLSQEGKEYLYWVNFCRSNPRKFWDSAIVPILAAFPELKGADAQSLYRDLYITGALPMMKANTTLINTAQAHAFDITRKNAGPSHTSTDGTDFSVRMKKAGIRTCAAENISVSSHSVLMSVVLLYLDIGLPNRGHRKSLLNPDLKETGIGVAPMNKESLFIVQDLSCLQ